MSPDELYVAAKELQAPYELVAEIAQLGKLPVVLFTAGGIATPADAAMMMQLGAEGVFVGSGIFKSGNPAERAAAIVKATTFYDDPDVIAKVSRGLGEAMVGIKLRRRTRVESRSRTGSPNAVGETGAKGPPVVGVLALQVTSVSISTALTACGAQARAGTPASQAKLDGIILPGGESTTIDKLARIFELRDPLVAALHGGLPAYGSCAAIILLADRILDLLPMTSRPSAGSTITVRRNAFGRQVESFECDVDLNGQRAAHRCTPCPSGPRGRSRSRTRRRGARRGPPPGTDVKIIAVRQRTLLATSFHPEITDDLRIHRYFLAGSPGL